MGEELQVGGRPEDNLEGRKKEGNRDRPSEPEGRGGEGRGGEGRGGEGRWDGTIGSPAQRIGASLRHATTSIIPEGMEASSPWLYNDTCPSESLRKKGIQGKILSVEGRGGGGEQRLQTLDLLAQGPPAPYGKDCS